MNKFISVFQYAKHRKIKAQTVYRWIRERKFNEDDVKQEQVLVSRLKIKKDASPLINVSNTYQH